MWTPRQIWAVRIARALAFAAVAVVIAFAVRRTTMQAPRAVEHLTLPPASVAPPSAFEPAWLLSHAAPLELSSRQVSELRKLERKYTLVAAALSHERDARWQELTRLLSEAQQRGGIPSIQLRQGMDAVAEVNQAIASARRRFRVTAESLLSIRQRRVARALIVGQQGGAELPRPVRPR